MIDRARAAYALGSWAREPDWQGSPIGAPGLSGCSWSAGWPT